MESVQLSCKLESNFLPSITAGANGVDYVIRECNSFLTTHPMKASIFNVSCSSSVLWATNAVPESSVSLQM